MRSSSKGVRWLSTVCACAVLMAGVASPALAVPKGKPGVTPPGVPPGQPFQALQKQIDALAGKVKALEAAAPKAGVMWVDPLGLSPAGTSTTSVALDLVGSGAQQGLVVGGSGAGDDVVQVGLQVPLGFAVAGVRVCYQAGPTGSSVSSAQLLQFGVPPALQPASPLNQSLTGLDAGETDCVDTTATVSANPSTGGPLYLSLGLHFTAAEAVVIRGVGLLLAPVAGP